jgi:6-phosphogluconolactonase
MHSRFVSPAFSFVLLALFMSAAAFATTPTVTVTSAANNSATTSPVNYVASASSPDCAQGISSMRIYSAPKDSAYTVAGGTLNAYINLPQGTYNTVVETWDNCGGVATANVTITITGETQPGGFVYTTNSNYTYGGNTSNTVQGFTIVASNGALAPTGQGPVNANVDPMSAASDKGGYRLYVGDYVSGDIFAYFIDRNNGYIFPVSGSPFPVNHSVTSVAVHPSGNFVFATRDENGSGDGVAVFAVQNDGSLVEAAGSPYLTQPGPWTMVMDPGGQYLYVATTDYYGVNQYFSIDAFAFNATLGVLTPVPGSPFAFRIPSACGATTLFPYGLFDLSSKYLYVADPGMDSISGATIASSIGNLAEIGGSPWPDEGGCNPPPNEPIYWAGPVSLAVDGAGKFLYALNAGAQNIAIYSIAANGALTFSKYAETGDVCSGSLGTDSTGSYLYAGNCYSSSVYAGYNAISGFSINPTTGDLTQLPGSPYTYPMGGNYDFMQSLTVTP